MLRYLLIVALSLLLVVEGCGRRQAAENREPDPTVENGRVIMVELDEWEIRPDPVSGKAGSLTFTATNVGQATHALEIEGQGVEHRTRDLEPGESATLDVNLEPGDYTLYCPIGNHEGRGMRVLFTVT